MNRPEQQQIDHWLKNAQYEIDHAWRLNREGFHEKNGVPLQAVYVGVAQDHAFLARVKFLNGDAIDEVHSEFTNAARCILKSFTMAYDEQDPDYQGKRRIGLKWEKPSRSMASILPSWPPISISPESWRAGFGIRPMGCTWTSRSTVTPMPSNTSCSVSGDRPGNLLRTQRDTYLGKPSQRNDYRKNYYTLSTALLGIVHQDGALFNKGLRMQLEFYQGDTQGELKDTDEEFICDYAVALANLGLQHGLAVTVEQATLPKGLLIRA